MPTGPRLQSSRAFLRQSNIVALIAVLASLGSWLVFWFGE
ncbi:hypothetical protein M2282_004636 [Variovorax boronicumulans]|nr:hypothetical protein [Variovorax boronicumulans]